MIESLNNKLLLNENVFICKLKDETKYILLKIKEETVPLFMKNEVIDILTFISKNQCTKESIIKHYGDVGEKAVEILNNYKIVYYENEEDNNLNINFNYEDQVNKLNYKAYVTRTPLTAKFEITYNCNYKCKYCYVDGVKGKMLPLEDIKIILTKLKENGVNKLYITGGEPFLHPNILDIIEYSSNLGFITTIQTNASFVDEAMAKRLKKYKHINLGISFHSAIEKNFDSFTQTIGSYKKTIEASRYLKENNIPFIFKLAVTKENQENLKRNIEFFEKNDIKFQVYTQIFPNTTDNVDNSKFFLDREYIAWLYKNNYLKLTRSNCSALKTKLWISSNGDVYPCELTRERIGNLINESFDSIWFSKEAEQVLKSNIYIEPPKCQKCDKKDYCNKCLAYLNYKNWSGGLDSFCQVANVVKNII